MKSTSGLASGFPSWQRVAFDSVGRWAFIVLCLFAIGPSLLAVTATLRDSHGGTAATFLTSSSGGGALHLVMIVVACAAVGAVGARFFTLGVGAMGAGMVAAWAAWGSATIDRVIGVTSDGSALIVLSIEGFLAGLIGAGLLFVIERVTRGAQPAGTADPLILAGAGKKFKRAMGGLVVTDRSASPFVVLGAALAASIVAAGIGTWFVAASMSKGQVLAASIVASILAGIAGHFAAHSTRGSVSHVVPALGVAVVALAGPLIAGMLHDAKLFQAVNSGALMPLARPIGLDWLAGILCGVPLGMAWVGLRFDGRAVANSPQEQYLLSVKQDGESPLVGATQSAASASKKA